MIKEEVKTIGNMIDELSEEDEELKELFGEENEELKYIFSTMKKSEMKKLMETGVPIEDIKKVLNGLLNIFNYIIEDMGEKKYKAKRELLGSVLHNVYKTNMDKIYKQMKRDISSKPDITLKEFYDKKFPEYKTKSGDSFNTMILNERQKKNMDITLKMSVAVLAFVDMEEDKK